MITEKQQGSILEKIIEGLDLPDSAYEKAKDRYDSLGEWFERDESKIVLNNPHIFPQGSFRLGTAIRPLNEKEEYDLDLACNLREKINKDTNTQYSLKELVGHELQAYRRAYGIRKAVEPKHRCWRLEYQDELSFHIDIVPCIPEQESEKKLLRASMMKTGTEELLSDAASDLAVSITDDRHHGFNKICDDWNISNPEGYAKWFENSMRMGDSFLTERANLIKAAKIDDLPFYKWKTPLQQSVQLLKRHRDNMFKSSSSDIKPISIIITTLASRAYQGESDVLSAMKNIVYNMEKFIDTEKPRVPNPVNPEEDFADRWSMPAYRHLQLEENFRAWLTQLKTDFGLIIESNDYNQTVDLIQRKFGLNVDNEEMRNIFDATETPHIYVPKKHVIEKPAKPWARRK